MFKRRTWQPNFLFIVLQLREVCGFKRLGNKEVGNREKP